jgi:hypothetical protein
MKDWHKLKPQLFRKKPYYLPGCDSYPHKMVALGYIWHCPVGNALMWISHRASNHLQVSWRPGSHIAEIRDAMGALRIAYSIATLETYGFGAAFRTAERIFNPLPFECRLSPLTQSYRAPAANSHFHPQRSWLALNGPPLKATPPHRRVDEGHALVAGGRDLGKSHQTHALPEGYHDSVFLDVWFLRGRMGQDRLQDESLVI